MYLSNSDTICAIATPPGPGGIGVVRISGPSSKDVLKRLWRGRVDTARFQPRRLYLGEVVATERTGPQAPRCQGSKALDKALAVWMPAPKTYTGQDVVEISCHGSPVVLRKILNACIEAGARLAGQGEFTRRAFMSGKIDLAQAEAVADLISASSERGARIAAAQLAGRLSAEVSRIGSELADIRTFVEASIDFPEEDVDFMKEGEIAKRLGVVIARAFGLARTFDEGRLIRDGARVAIAGRSNTGKSSLLNRMVGCARALVHETPGTTRDVIEEMITLDGYAFRLRDTAGVSGSAKGVEAMGVELARSEIELADIVLLVIDGSRELGDEDLDLIESCANRRSAFAVNKCDLALRADVGRIRGTSGIDLQMVSALTGEGVDSLKNILVGLVRSDASQAEGAVVTSVRHKTALDEAVAALSKARDALDSREPAECVAQHLRMAQEALGLITGEFTTEELLDRIFSSFCVGK